eukprot:1897229-Prymnesium_polylepis.1
MRTTSSEPRACLTRTVSSEPPHSPRGARGRGRQRRTPEEGARDKCARGSRVRWWDDPARPCETLRDPARPCETLRDPARPCKTLQDPARGAWDLRAGGGCGGAESGLRPHPHPAKPHTPWGRGASARSRRTPGRSNRSWASCSCSGARRSM